jgi:RNA polymerase sigma-70 factor (ECF subfamily)
LAYHKSLNRRKYLALRGTFEDRQIDEFEQTAAQFPFGGVRNGSSQDEDTLAVVRQGLEALTPKQREVVQLACFEGYLLSEIADRTKESLGNVRHHYYRGIDKLREFVKEKTDPTRGGQAAFMGGGK